MVCLPGGTPRCHCQHNFWLDEDGKCTGVILRCCIVSVNNTYFQNILEQVRVAKFGPVVARNWVRIPAE